MPTPFLRNENGALWQNVKVTIRHAGSACAGILRLTAQGRELRTAITLAHGQSVLDARVTEVSAPCELACELILDKTQIALKRVPWQPPRRWIVHVVQLSHHDVGYTDLASNVGQQQDCWLDSVIDMAAATRDFPEHARFRAIIEQTWSIDHFLRNARPERAAAMLGLLRCGDLELTAMFGNMITELCGHETLVRSIYHAFRLKREHGIPIISAEHNDIPGFSWGLSQVLTGAGVKIFCPGLPLYYSWGHPGARSFWDETALFGAPGIPGAFWWESPAGKKILFWCNNQGCGGDCHTDLPLLPKRLQEIEKQGYPYTILRWPVSGGARDNSPYIAGYADTIRDWNERWAYPHLISSTNACFYNDLLPHLPATLPIIRGDVPGQDYPVGAASTAIATGVNRRNHSDLPAAETLATMAGAITDYHYQRERIFNAYEETLWHDEHSWGHHFPCGPAANASELEKALHAHRGATLAHDVLNKAMARIADAVRLDQPGIHLVVFNSLPHECTGLVSTPLREIDNCGSTMTTLPDKSLRGVLLHDRWHVNLPMELCEGRFDLIDVETGAVMPFQIDQIESTLAPTPHAAQRLGLGAGGKRYGFFENPAGLARDLLFIAEKVPSLGYRTYRLQPRSGQPVFPIAVTATAATLENAWYKLEVDSLTGSVRSLIDKETGRDLVDPNALHPFGALVIRDPSGNETLSSCSSVRASASGPLAASLCIRLSAHGHPCIELTLTLYSGEKRLDIGVALLKDSTPLLETHLALPFNLPQGRFRYEGPLCILNPSTDMMPGAYADRLTMQNWVSASDAGLTVLLSSHEAPVMSLARLWPGRLSPAHSAVVRKDMEHPIQKAEDLRGGAIYSLLTANNFGTNFAVSQCGSMLFRYCLTTTSGPLSDAQASALGQRFLNPFKTIFTKHPGPRPLLPANSLLSIDNPAIRLVALKQAEAGNGLILRLWNPGADPAAARITLPEFVLASARFCTLAEEDIGESLQCEEHSVNVCVAARSVVTIQLVMTRPMPGP